jgi:hypothetical protein
MFGFVRFTAKPLIRTRKTTPPHTAGTPPWLTALRGAECHLHGNMISLGPTLERFAGKNR